MEESDRQPGLWLDMRTWKTTLIDVEICAGHEPGDTIGNLGQLVDKVFRNFKKASASGGTSLHG